MAGTRDFGVQADGSAEDAVLGEPDVSFVS